MQKWEYKVEAGKPNAGIQPALNKLGNDGWELIGVVATPPDASGNTLGFFFKRPKP